MPTLRPRPKRLLLVAAAGLLAMGATAVAAATPPAPDGLVNAAAAGGPFTLDQLRPPTFSPPTTAAPAISLPTPVMPPADPYAPEPAIVLGTIEIPRIGLIEPLNQGISLRSIDRGPSHWPGTALPGDPGNVVIAGHRVTKTAPFRNIDQLQSGDAVIFTVDGQRSTYVVTGAEVVTPDAMRIVEQTPASTGTLFACHPPGSAQYRYVVSLALSDVVALDTALMAS